MSRKAALRSLPKLRTLFPRFKPFREEVNKRHFLEEHLRKAATTLRSQERTTFYSMREVADFFQVSLKSVAVVYGRLSKEGLITICRGSKTILEGRKSKPRSGIRGVVGIPVHLPSFIFGSNPRNFYIRLEDELRRQGYVADFIFYASMEIGSHALTDKLLAHNMDILFWLAPAPKFAQTLLRLQDAGVELVVVGDGEGALPMQHYLMDLDQGFQEAAAGWKNEGLTEVFLIHPKDELSIHFRRKCRAAFQHEGFVIHDEIPNPETFPESVSQYQKHPKAGLVFLEHFHYEALCNYDWKAMKNLFKLKRTLLAQGLVFHPAFTGQPIFVDTSEVPFNLIARRISTDIAQRNYLNNASPITFASSWHPNSNLGDVRATWGL